MFWKKKIIKFIEVYDVFIKKLAYIAGGLVILMMLFIVRETFGRYFFNDPTLWSLELCMMLFVALIYMGGAYTTNSDLHPRADFFYNQYKGKTKVFFDTIIHILCIAYLLVLMQQGTIMVLESLHYSETTSGVFRVPLFPVKAMVPLGSFLVIISLINKIILTFIRGSSNLTE